MARCLPMPGCGAPPKTPPMISWAASRWCRWCLRRAGLDVTPGMIKIFETAGEIATVEAMEMIYAEEVSHVAYGSKWFHFLCGRHDLDPKEVFHTLVRRYFHGPLKAAI